MVYSPKHDRSENCTQFLTTSLHLKTHFESRRIDPVCMQYRLCIVYPQTMTSHLKHSTFTSCYTSLKVVSCEEVTTSCCVGCVQTWVSSRSWPEEGGGEVKGEQR